jgi:hypothetical protein
MELHIHLTQKSDNLKEEIHRWAEELQARLWPYLIAEQAGQRPNAHSSPVPNTLQSDALCLLCFTQIPLIADNLSLES